MEFPIYSFDLSTWAYKNRGIETPSCVLVYPVSSHTFKYFLNWMWLWPFWGAVLLVLSRYQSMNYEYYCNSQILKLDTIDIKFIAAYGFHWLGYLIQNALLGM